MKKKIDCSGKGMLKAIMEYVPNSDFEYKRVKVLRVIDGDTLVLEVDVGFGFTFKDTFRLNRINAPEIRGKQKEYGLTTKSYVIETFEEAELAGKKLKIQTFKKGKFGRWICEIWVDGINLSDDLIKKGLAIPKEY